MQWFQKKHPQPSRPEAPSKYPEGVAVQDETGEIYYIQDNKKLRLFSPRVADSWRFNLLLGSTESLSEYKRGKALGFRNGSLIKNIADGKYYLIEKNKRRHIQNPDFIEKLGFSWEWILLVSQSEINLHEEGEAIT